LKFHFREKWAQESEKTKRGWETKWMVVDSADAPWEISFTLRLQRSPVGRGVLATRKGY
jgi:hypothetical protein